MSPRLLILDDDESIRVLLQRYFEGLGWRVSACDQVPDGLHLVDSLPFDAVICDLNLGVEQGDSGLSIVTRVRERRPGAAILVFTADGGDGVRAAAVRAGADEVISKPAPLAHLRDAAVRAMKGR